MTRQSILTPRRQGGAAMAGRGGAENLPGLAGASRGEGGLEAAKG